jgi:hypothetical protein
MIQQLKRENRKDNHKTPLIYTYMYVYIFLLSFLLIYMHVLSIYFPLFECFFYRYIHFQSLYIRSFFHHQILFCFKCLFLGGNFLGVFFGNPCFHTNLSHFSWSSFMTSSAFCSFFWFFFPLCVCVCARRCLKRRSFLLLLL